MRRFLFLFISLLLATQAFAFTPVSLAPTGTINPGFCPGILTGTATYALNKAITGSAGSAAIDLGTVDCFSFSITATANAVQVWVGNSSSTNTAGTLYGLAGVGSYSMPKVARYAWFKVPGAAMSVTVPTAAYITPTTASVWYFLPSPSGTTAANQSIANTALGSISTSATSMQGFLTGSAATAANQVTLFGAVTSTPAINLAQINGAVPLTSSGVTGKLPVLIAGSTGSLFTASAVAGSSNIASGSVALNTISNGFMYNGSSWTAQRAIIGVDGTPALSVFINGNNAGVSITSGSVGISSWPSATQPVSVVASTTVTARLGDGSNFFDSIAGPGGMYYLGTGIIQDVHASLSNTTTENLNAGATYTGVTESTMSSAGIQINFFANQTCTVQVQQSADGTNWDTNDSYTVLASTDGSRTFQAVGQYYRVVVTNNGAAATTALRLKPFLCPVVEAVPRTLTANGNLKVAVQEFRGPRANKVKGFQTITNTVETTIIAAQGDRTYTDMSNIVISNKSGITITAVVRDSLAGATITAVTLAPSGGGAVIPYGMALWPQSVSNTPWTVQLDQVPSGGLSPAVYCTFFGFKVTE